MSVSLKSSTAALVSYQSANGSACTTEPEAGALPVKRAIGFRPGDIIKAAAEREKKERKSRGRPKGTGGEGDDADPPPAKHHIDAHAKAIIASAPDDEEILLTTPEVATWLRVSKAWLEIGRSRGYGPDFTRLSSQVVRYRVGDVKKWLRDRQHAHTAEYAD